jgi:hypothetical protein
MIPVLLYIGNSSFFPLFVSFFLFAPFFVLFFLFVSNYPCSLHDIWLNIIAFTKLFLAITLNPLESCKIDILLLMHDIFLFSPQNNKKTKC